MKMTKTPENIKERLQKTTFVHMRCTVEQKAKWHECAASCGLPLSKWITQALERHVRITDQLVRRQPHETTNKEEANG